MSERVERRRSLRRPVIETFSCFVVLSSSVQRLTLVDLSEGGLSFYIDEPLAQLKGLEVKLYINQSLFIPLRVNGVRTQPSDAQFRHLGKLILGVEFIDRSTPQYAAYAAFLNLVDCLKKGSVFSS